METDTPCLPVDKLLLQVPTHCGTCTLQATPTETSTVKDNNTSIATRNYNVYYEPLAFVVVVFVVIILNLSLVTTVVVIIMFTIIETTTSDQISLDHDAHSKNLKWQSEPS